MKSALWRRYAAVLFLLVAGVVDVSAGTFTLFGPQTFTRKTGEPVVERVTFQAPTTSGYVLKVESDGVASAIVTLHGATVLTTNDFRPSVTAFQKAVTLRTPSNVLTVELRSEPGTWVRFSIVGTDNDAPNIRAAAAPAAPRRRYGVRSTTRSACIDGACWRQTIVKMPGLSAR